MKEMFSRIQHKQKMLMNFHANKTRPRAKNDFSAFAIEKNRDRLFAVNLEVKTDAR